jgi:Rod binding domain-containing protein
MLDAAGMMDQAYYSLQSSRQPNISSATSDPDKARQAAEDFESFFVTMFLEGMFAGIKSDSLFGGGHGEDVFRSVLLQEYGKEIVKAGGFGIADSVEKEILKLQEVKEG